MFFLAIFSYMSILSQENDGTKSVSFLFPSDNSILPEDFIGVFEIKNFSIPQDGFIKVSMKSNTFDDIIFYFNIETNHSYFNVQPGSIASITLELVDTNRNSFAPEVQSVINFTTVQSVAISDLSQLRKGNLEDYYKLTNDVFITYQKPSVSQIYVDDGTAGIVLDNPFLTNMFGPYINGITNVIGKLRDNNGVLKFIHYNLGDRKIFDSSEIVISDNSNVSFSSLLNNLEDYESEFVTIESGHFLNSSNGQLFESDTEYTISNTIDNIGFRTIFSEVDYIGNEIPEFFSHITGIVSEFNGVPQITPINQAGIIKSSLAVNSVKQETLKVFPNPTLSGNINIDYGSNKKDLYVSVYNNLGKELIHRQRLEGDLDVSKLSSGIYLIKVEDNLSFKIKKMIVY